MIANVSKSYLGFGLPIEKRKRKGIHLHRITMYYTIMVENEFNVLQRIMYDIILNVFTYLLFLKKKFSDLWKNIEKMHPRQPTNCHYIGG